MNKQIFYNTPEGRSALRRAMKGKDVYIDNYCYSQTGVQTILAYTSGNVDSYPTGLAIEHEDKHTLKLAGIFK